MRRTVILLIASLLLLLPSCAPSDDFQGGRPITKEDLESMSSALFETTSEPSDTETVEPDPDRTVYWLESGSVYHSDADCSHIAGKENVKQSTAEEAEANGRRLCKTCEKKGS